jgi:hypothetical protein
MHIKGGTQTEGAWEQGAEENIWNLEGGSNSIIRSFIISFLRQILLKRTIPG